MVIIRKITEGKFLSKNYTKKYGLQAGSRSFCAYKELSITSLEKLIFQIKVIILNMQ